MAIFGAGSVWYEYDEKKDLFFSESKFILGWGYEKAKDLYEAIASLKTGDIIYLKSNAPGRTIRVKGIGIVSKSVIQCMIDNEYSENISEGECLFVKVNWICKKEFHIEIESKEGRLTNIRTASFYEEYLPYVQNKIIEKIISTA